MIDLYAGPLQRYYTRRWETSAEVACREMGMSFQTIFKDGQDLLSLSDDDAQAEIRAFERRLEPKLHLDSDPAWHESFSTPYDTLQLTHDGFGALVLWTAYLHRDDLQRPLHLPEDPWSDVAVSEADERGYYMGPLAILESHMMVPGQQPRITSEEDPAARKLVITTTSALGEALDFVSESLSLSAERANEIARSGPPARKEVLAQQPKKWFGLDRRALKTERVPPLEDELRTLTEYAVSAFMVMLAFSMDHSVPIVRDE